MTVRFLMAALMVCAVYASGAEIGGKFAFGFEQGVAVGSDASADVLGRGCSFKICLSNVIAIKAAVGFNFSQKAPESYAQGATGSPDLLYREDQDRIDYSAAAYGILVFRRFERVHLNGMTGILIASRGTHFKDDALASQSINILPGYGTANRKSALELANEQAGKTTDIHLRILMAPEIFLFPNFSLEYKYGFDVAIRKYPIMLENTGGNVTATPYVINERKRLTVDVIGDLNLVNSASVHFYF